MALRDLTRGNRPDLTAAQIIAALLTAIPTLLVLFGIELSGEKTAALGGLIATGVALIGGDAYLRGKRNEADALSSAAGAAGAGGVPPAPEEAFADEVGDPAGAEHVPDAMSLQFVAAEDGEESELDGNEDVFEDEDDDPTGVEHVPDDVTL
ncbi:MAG TPA: hypothetical protein VF712_10305 [Thermoleophilaceae bacterium]|jgi:hypothetical protein